MKPWSRHTKPTNTGERILIQRLMREMRIPRDAAELFVTARVNPEDLRNLMYSAGKRYVLSQPSYQFMTYYTLYPEAFPWKLPNPTKEEVAEQFGAVLAAQVGQRTNADANENRRNDPHHYPLDLSWGQLVGRPKLLYALPGMPPEMPEGIARAVADTIATLDFIGPGESLAEQQALGQLLSTQGFEIRHGLSKMTVVPKSAQSRPTQRIDPLEYDMHRIIRSLQENSSRLGGEEGRALHRLQGRTEQLLSRFRNQQASSVMGGDDKTTFADQLGELRAEYDAIVNPQPMKRQDFAQRLGLGSKVKKPPVTPLVLEGGSDDRIDEGVSAPFKATREDHAVDGQLLLKQAGELANELSFFNDSRRVSAYQSAYKKNPGRANHVTLGARGFVASRIIGGHGVYDLLGSHTNNFLNGALPDEADVMQSVYCLATGLAPVFALKPRTHYDRLPLKDEAPAEEGAAKKKPQMRTIAYDLHRHVEEVGDDGLSQSRYERTGVNPLRQFDQLATQVAKGAYEQLAQGQPR